MTAANLPYQTAAEHMFSIVDGKSSQPLALPMMVNGSKIYDDMAVK